jgi:hypothetical protein
MMHGWLADLVVAIHALFVVFVVVGGFLATWKPWIAFLHVPAALWGAFVEFSGRICPLTPLENEFRRLAGDAGYSGGFIQHYITPLLYPEGLTRDLQFLLGGGVVVINVVAYAILVWKLVKKAG